jgi:RNA polymerase sigma-70 factor (ECF subfamily)
VPDDDSFEDFIRRIRRGDDEAAAQLVRQFEPVIRLEVRRRLSDPRLYRVLDSMDICQSVLASFFVRVASGQYELDQPGKLLKLLVAMARNKLAFQCRQQRYQRRDQRRLAPGGQEILGLVPGGPTPDRVVAAKDLLGEVRRRLTADERRLADLRGEGWTWPEIANALGGTAEARRQQLDRALDRASRQLGLEDGMAH